MRPQEAGYIRSLDPLFARFNHVNERLNNVLTKFTNDEKLKYRQYINTIQSNISYALTDHHFDVCYMEIENLVHHVMTDRNTIKHNII